MRLYMVRRTRTFIQDNYAEIDPVDGRKYLTFDDGTRSYFPARVPRTVKFSIAESDLEDQYGQLYATSVVETINSLNLPRYGLGNYVVAKPKEPSTAAEAKVLDDLSRAGKRLMGFCRTNFSNDWRAAVPFSLSRLSGIYFGTSLFCMPSSRDCLYQ